MGREMSERIPVRFRYLVLLGLTFHLLLVVGIPWSGGARINADMTAAVASLRNLHAAQKQFRDGGAADLDGDGVSGYGSFLELSAATAVRGDAQVGLLAPPLMSPAWRRAGPAGVVTRSGYRFRIFLPASDGGWRCPDARGFRWSAIDPDRAEREWRAYAWPTVWHEESHGRTFFLDASGAVLAAETDAWEKGAPPAADAREKDGVEWTEIR